MVQTNFSLKPNNDRLTAFDPGQPLLVSSGNLKPNNNNDRLTAFDPGQPG